jgi:hypothetical protein
MNTGPLAPAPGQPWYWILNRHRGRWMVSTAHSAPLSHLAAIDVCNKLNASATKDPLIGIKFEVRQCFANDPVLFPETVAATQRTPSLAKPQAVRKMYKNECPCGTHPSVCGFHKDQWDQKP